MLSSNSECHNPQQTTEAQSLRSGETFSDLQVALSDIEKSLEGISSACTVYSDCAEKIKEQPPPVPTFQQDVDTFSKDIELQEGRQREVFNRITVGFEHDIKKQVELTLGDRLSDVIREETAKMVREEVEQHIKDHLPVSLKEQAEESTAQLQDIRISLQNSLARTQNSFVERMRLDDQLLPLLTPIGEKSPHHPSSITRLFDYDLPKAKALSKDYGLADSDDIRTHFQQFLRHIGTSVDVVIPTCDLELEIDPEDLDN